ncbi:nuclear transport factor 2 family protein [Photobacterium kasasachensis]|uniref:nuclear transport factor 2 family protein n=1 Tax=Photobacterium kasasachensis TaxID=2910240 RepID=UPI003D0B176F
MNSVNDYMNKLYQIVDNRDADSLANFLDEDVCFKFSNAEQVTGKMAVLDINRHFFHSIEKMSHTLEGVWQQGTESICNGTVDYIRKDGSHYSARFATILTIKDGLITKYRIYADVSGL